MSDHITENKLEFDMR